MSVVAPSPTVRVPLAGHFVRPDLARIRESLSAGRAAAVPAALPAALSSLGLLGAITLGTLSTVALPMAAAHSAAAPASFSIAEPGIHAQVLPAAKPATAHKVLKRAARAEVRKPIETIVYTTVAGRSESGIASWYGAAFAGRTTSSGEVFDPSTMTAAHKTLPFGTHVRVCTQTGSCVVVKITDRGPYVSGRIIDLSYAAAQAIGMGGVAYVTITPVEPSVTISHVESHVVLTAAPVTQAVAPRASRSHLRTRIVAGEKHVARVPGTLASAKVHRVTYTLGNLTSQGTSDSPLTAVAPLTTLAAFGGFRGKFNLALDETPELPAAAH